MHELAFNAKLEMKANNANMDTTDTPKQKVLKQLLQTCVTMRSGGNLDIAIAAAEVEGVLRSLLPSLPTKSQPTNRPTTKGGRRPRPAVVAA